MSPFDEPGLRLSAWGELLAAIACRDAAADVDRVFCLPRRGLFPVIWLRRSLAGPWGQPLGGPLCARRRLALCRGQPKPDCRQCPKMVASHRQVPLAAGLLDGSEGAALGRALADGHHRANRFPAGSPGHPTPA